MWSGRIGVLVFLLFGVSCAENVTSGKNLFCYYDGNFSQKEEYSMVSLADLEEALPLCTHLIYGYAGINTTTFRIKPMHPQLDLDKGKGFYRNVVGLKQRFPGLKIFLSVGGKRDQAEKKPFQKYLSLLESETARQTFVDSAYALLTTYGFDGLDLAWQFPQTKPRRIRDWTGNLWHVFKKWFTGDSVLDPKANEHREEFTALVRSLKNAFQQSNFQLMYTQLPHTNQTVFLDIPLLKDYLDYVNVAAYDQYTPERNPYEADYYAPIYAAPNRTSGNNLDDLVKAWISQGTPLEKIVVGIATHGRGWQLTAESGTSGVPPIRTNGPSAPAGFTDTPGFYSFSEVCFRIRKLPVPSKGYKGERELTRVDNPDTAFGPYAYRIPVDHQIGIWLSYENQDSVASKAAYVKDKGLGGLSLNDLALDDYRGRYYEVKFPLLRAAHSELRGLTNLDKNLRTV